ncbi:glutamate receptor [Hyalella azteca]|uniref:Glutamate receptor n=1 Tax=Hyalella azteca TaxID=294128 RepID=A0A8B7NLZ3_HYAAZ|nr:glutamate receptor [Hyalella azteca]
MFYKDNPYTGVYRRLITSLKNWNSNAKALFEDKLTDFEGAVLRVSTFEHPPSVLYHFDKDMNINERLGIDMNLLASLERVLNFKSLYSEVNANELWGYQLENGTWLGLMGELIYEKADIGICNFFIEEGRWLFIDYTAPYNFENGCFVTASPKSLPQWTSPILPFSAETWAFVAFSFVVATVTLYGLVYMGMEKESAHFNSISFTCLYILGFFTVRGQSIFPRFGPLKVYLTFLGLFATLMTTAYSANLIAFLTIVPKMPPINTIKQLKESSLRIGGVPFWETQFSDSIDSDIRSLAPRLEPRYDLENLFNYVEAGTFAIIENKQYLELFVEGRYTYGDTASIRIVGQCLLPYNIGVGIQKFSPLRETFSNVILHIFESGITQKWKKDTIVDFRDRHREEIDRNKRPAESDVKSLSVHHLLGVFMMLVGGLSLALVAFVAEIFAVKLTMRKKLSSFTSKFPLIMIKSNEHCRPI